MPRDHASTTLLIDEIAPDFQLLDVWALPAHGPPGTFDDLLIVWHQLDPAQSTGLLTRWLFALRAMIGRWLRWDDDTPIAIPGCKESSLAARLPPELRMTAIGLTNPSFKPLYRSHNEWAAEISNATVHAVMHLGWRNTDSQHAHGTLRVYAKPRGQLGAWYLWAIAPFRRFIVYPALLRRLDVLWQERMKDFV